MTKKKKLSTWCRWATVVSASLTRINATSRSRWWGRTWLTARRGAGAGRRKRSVDDGSESVSVSVGFARFNDLFGINAPPVGNFEKLCNFVSNPRIYMLVLDKHSSLLSCRVHEGGKSFTTLATGVNVIKILRPYVTPFHNNLKGA
jgi:hypothetical protein